MGKLLVYLIVLPWCISLKTSHAQSWHGLGVYPDSVYSWCFYTDSATGYSYIGGSFKSFAGVTANNVVQWDGQQWLPMGDGFNNRVLAIGKYKGQLYAAGRFDSSGVTKFTMPIARWTGAAWVPIDTSFNILQHPGTGPRPYISDFVEFDNRLFILGKFYAYPSWPIPPGWQQFFNFAYWNDTTWLPGTFYYSGGVSGSDEDQKMVVFNNELYIGTIGNDTCTSIPNSANWIAGLRKYDPVCRSFQQIGNWGPGLSGFKVYNGSLYIGYGYYHSLYGKCITRFDGTNFHQVGSGFNNRVSKFTIYNNKLIAMGRFTWDGDNQMAFQNSIAEWDGTSWQPFVSSCQLSGIGLYGIVNGAVINNNLVVSGYGMDSCGVDYIGFTASYPNSLTGIHDINHVSSEHIYLITPNPATNRVHIVRKDGTSIKTLQINMYDLTGRKIHQVMLKNPGNNPELDISNMNNGLYIVKITEPDHQHHTLKLVIQQ